VFGTSARAAGVPAVRTESSAASGLRADDSPPLVREDPVGVVPLSDPAQSSDAVGVHVVGVEVVAAGEVRERSRERRLTPECPAGLPGPLDVLGRRCRVVPRRFHVDDDRRVAADDRARAAVALDRPVHRPDDDRRKRRGGPLGRRPNLADGVVGEVGERDGRPVVPPSRGEVVVQHRLEVDVRHRLDRGREGSPAVRHPSEFVATDRRVAGVDTGHHECEVAVTVVGELRGGRNPGEVRRHTRLVGGGLLVRPVRPERVVRVGGRHPRLGVDHVVVERVEVELEGGHDADGPAAFRRPQEVVVPLGGRGHAFAAAGDDVDRPEVVGGEAVLRREVARTAAEREPRHPGVGDHTTRRRQPERLGGAVDQPPVRPRADADCPGVGVDANPPQPGAVDDEAAGDDRRTGDAVAAAPNRGVESVVAGERDRRNHVVDGRTVGHRRGVLVHHPVPDPARVRVRVVRGNDDLAVEPPGEGRSRERRRRRQGVPVRVHTGATRQPELRFAAGGGVGGENRRRHRREEGARGSTPAVRPPDAGHRMMVTGTAALSTTLFATLPTTCSRSADSPR